MLGMKLNATWFKSVYSGGSSWQKPETKISPQETRYFVLNIVNIPLISEGQNEFTLVTGVSFFN